MKNGKRLLQKTVEEEAVALEKRVKYLNMDIPTDAKRPEELLDELLEKFREGLKI